MQPTPTFTAPNLAQASLSFLLWKVPALTGGQAGLAPGRSEVRHRNGGHSNH
jgi:hypothetical protein